MTTDTTYAAHTVFTTPVLSVAPVVLPAPERAVDLHVRVSAPVTGEALPIILLSHGHGRSQHLSSLDGYAPLANFWAARGFVVIQPTHLDSATLRLGNQDPDAPLYWRTQTKDMSHILDHLDLIEAAIPQLRDRMNHSTVAVAGHSLGGLTASLLLGARVTDPQHGAEVTFFEPRIAAGVVLAAPGRGGDALSQSLPPSLFFLSSIDFTQMSTPALIVAGDNDASPHLTVNGPAWHADPYLLSPGPKSLITLFGGEHGLGGISGYDAAETTDENPQRVEAVQWLTWAYLRTHLGIQDTAWPTAQTSFTTATTPLGRIESK